MEAAPSIGVDGLVAIWLLQDRRCFSILVGHVRGQGGAGCLSCLLAGLAVAHTAELDDGRALTGHHPSPPCSSQSDISK